MRVLGVPIASPDAVTARALSDLAALARAARRAPEQLERMLTLAEEIVAIGGQVLELGERIDSRAEAMLALGERIDARAEALLALGGQIDASGAALLDSAQGMSELGERIDARGAEIVDRATRVVQSAGDLIGVLPTLERAIEMTTPLEGAIDRFGRLVDRLPGGNVRRRGVEGPATAPPDPSPDRPEPPDDPALGRS
jgi:hypothetical protein